jgi:hypothetical protein
MASLERLMDPFETVIAPHGAGLLCQDPNPGNPGGRRSLDQNYYPGTALRVLFSSV